MCKIPCKGMVLLLKCDLTNTFWYEVNVGLIGPCSAKLEHFQGKVYALICIDTTTNLVELVCTDSKSSSAIDKIKKLASSITKTSTSYPR